MTPIEKAEAALNRRIEQLQGTLRDTKSEAAQRFLFQSLVICIGIGEALKDYIKTIGEFANARHSQLKADHVTLTAQHADLLKSGNELLERLKASPADRGIRKEIELAQKNMEGIQKSLRRGANALQRAVAPSIAMIDQVALSIRRLGEADQIDALKRVTVAFIGHVHELYRAQPSLPAKGIIDAAGWEQTAAAEIDRASDFYEAFACAGYQAIRALDLMSLAVSPAPPQTLAEATDRANDSVATRLKDITARFSTS